MSRCDVTRMTPVPDSLLVVLELMRTLALSGLEEHTDKAGQCVVCGSAWPWEPVVVATHNLAVI